MNWIEVNVLIPHDLGVFLSCWSNEATSRKLRQGLWIIRNATMWSIWKMRNDTNFNNVILDVIELVDNIKHNLGVLYDLLFPFRFFSNFSSTKVGSLIYFGY